MEIARFRFEACFLTVGYCTGCAHFGLGVIWLVGSSLCSIDYILLKDLIQCWRGCFGMRIAVDWSTSGPVWLC